MSETRYTDQHEWIRLDGDTATVGIQTHDHGTVQVDLAWQPPGGKVVDIPGGVQFVHLHRLDGGLDDVSVTWQ